MSSPVGIVSGPCETVEIGTSHQSIMPEQRGDDASHRIRSGNQRGMLSRASAAVSSQEPSELTRPPAHSSRKSRIRSAWSTIATYPFSILTE